MTSRPVASITVWPSAGRSGATFWTVSPARSTSAFLWPSALTTVPFLIRVDIGTLLRPYGSGRGALRPGLRREPVIHSLHGDAAFYRAHQGTEIATDTVVFIHPWNSFQRGHGIAPNRAGIEFRNGRGGDAPRCLRLDHGRRASDIG